MIAKKQHRAPPLCVIMVTLENHCQAIWQQAGTDPCQSSQDNEQGGPKKWPKKMQKKLPRKSGSII